MSLMVFDFCGVAAVVVVNCVDEDDDGDVDDGDDTDDDDGEGESALFGWRLDVSSSIKSINSSNSCNISWTRSLTFEVF